MDPEKNFSSFKDSDHLATHAVVYFVLGLYSSFKFFFDYCATHCVTSYKLISTFFRVWSTLELSWKLHVVANVSDGASTTTTLYEMPHLFCDNADKEVFYRTIKLYILERFVYLFPHSSHLIKRARNCLYHSGSGRGTQDM